MRVLYNGVNLTQFKPDRPAGECERDALGIRGPVVLYVGRVCRQKGTHVLLEAYQRVRHRRSDVRLVVAGPVAQFGSAEDPDDWKGAINRAGGLYLGPVEERRLAAIYNLADVYVMPTIDLEMFGMAAVEAMACGTPVIASDHGGLRETVPRECGGRFPVGSAPALAAEIEKLLSDRPRQQDAARTAIRHSSQYDWRNICRELETIYRLGGTHAGG
jgi:glycosyltransferase involved in cell wall biosynthesis